jgi:ABC-type transport system involved in Fe-S cluster assembly fused permease/ATPase subunit
MEEAARLANAHDVFSAFLHLYHAAVWERGVHLSGGQEHCVAIACPILTRPRVLLLVEVTPIPGYKCRDRMPLTDHVSVCCVCTTLLG